MRTLLPLIALVVLAVSGCGDSGKKNNGIWSAAGKLFPYDSSAPYADVLVNCVNADTVEESCTLETLPPLAMSTPYPSVDEVMERVVVSHQWMGENFRALLEAQPEDLRTMFGAVTAVVIGADIRPSYYWGLTGAIYLDPYHLWLTQEDKSVISRKQDYRAGFSDPMNFRSFWRTARDNGDAYPYFGLDSPYNRTIDDIIIPMSALLFHELAHANDILAPHNYGLVDMSDSVVAATDKLRPNHSSVHLVNELPLESDFMRRMAEILFVGQTPTDDETRLTAFDVAAEFAPDRASDDYAYASQYEDFAMLFEEVMMKIYFDVDRDIAYVELPVQNNYCNDYKVAWGVRNRAGEPRVKQRAEMVIEAILPNSDYTQALADFPAPTDLPVGWGWCESIDPNAVQSTKPGSGDLEFNQPVPADHYTRPYDIMR